MGGTRRTRSTHRTRNTTSKGGSTSGHVERVSHETHTGHVAGTCAGQRAMGRGQWGRQQEQFDCCFLETVSVHPEWSTQGSGCSRHHSSARRKIIHNAINNGVGASMEAPPTDATTLGLAVSVLAGPTAMALKRRGVVRFVCRGPHRGRATHPHPKTVCLKICCLGCSNLGGTDLLNLHISSFSISSPAAAASSGGCSPISASLFAAPALSLSAASGSCGGSTGGVDSSSGSVLIGCCRTRKTRDTCNPPPDAS